MQSREDSIQLALAVALPNATSRPPHISSDVESALVAYGKRLSQNLDSILPTQSFPNHRSLALVRHISSWLRESPHRPIQTALHGAVDQGLIDGSVCARGSEQEQQAMASFACVMGHMTMLFRPQAALAPGMIEADSEGAPCFDSPSQNLEQGRKSFTEIMTGFGPQVFLPHHNQAFESDHTTGDHHGNLNDVVDADFLNAAFLIDTRRVQIKWVSSLGAHLELDWTTRTLFLFEMPSFLLLQMNYGILNGIVERMRAGDEMEDQHGGVFHEILLSYFLLFRNQTRSRKRYKLTRKKRAKTSDFLDPLLDELCCGGVDAISFIRGNPRLNRFSKTSDFPFLAGRFSELQRFVQETKIDGVRGLYRNKRGDTYSWYTFWAVMFFGTIGLVLNVIQVVLTGIQTGYSAQQAVQGGENSKA